MKKNLLSLILFLLLIPLSLPAQNLGPEEELYLTDPDPRFHGDQVRTLQRYLLFQGLDIGSDGIDGWFGKDTLNALLAYQSHQGLETTGRIKVKDFSDPLVWSPLIQTFLFTGWPEGPFPGNDYAGEILKPQPGKDFVYKSFFGTITISASEIKNNGYQSFIHSPAKRFLAAVNRDKTSVTLWDILSGTRLICPLESTAMDSDCQRTPEEYTRFEVEGITWWMDPMKYDYAQLTFVVFFTFEGPQHKRERSLITVSPYIQTD